jgi:hypothetical protein
MWHNQNRYSSDYVKPSSVILFAALDNSDGEQQTVTAADVCLYGLNIIMPLMTVDLLKFPSLCMQYFKMITFVCEIYPDKVCQLPVDLLKNLLNSIELGLTTFGQDVIVLCTDFIQVLGSHVYCNSLQNTPVYEALRPLLKVRCDSGAWVICLLQQPAEHPSV